MVIDARDAFDDPRWGRRNNRDAGRNIADLVDAFGNARLPVVFVQHAATLVATQDVVDLLQATEAGVGRDPAIPPGGTLWT
ncbi:hypothetical protein ASC64_07130 [Nocardioides sp. Root122]|nr:hypothetical protein ASC64_07130 [Nocardioides sp. Root122]